MHSVNMCLIGNGFWYGMHYGASSFLRRYEWVMCECPILNLDNVTSSFLDILVSFFFVIFLFVTLFRVVYCSGSYPSNSAIFVLYKCLWFFLSL